MDHTANPNDWIYDIETYFDIFSCGVVNAATRERFIFEVSDRRDQSKEFVYFLEHLGRTGQRLFGFNNFFFDWPVCDHLIKLTHENGHFTALDAHSFANQLIGGDFNKRWDNTIPPWKQIVTQGDLYRIHHFDNQARSTSLKKLEINMRSRRVIDLPYPPHDPTTDQQKTEIIAYMCHDINETWKFYRHTIPQIAFRDELVAQGYGKLGDVLNFNDGKIGAQMIIDELETIGIKCFNHEPGQRKEPITTQRDYIHIRDILSPKVVFRHSQLQYMYQWLSEQSLRPDQTKGFFGSFNTVILDGHIQSIEQPSQDRKKSLKESGHKIVDKLCCVVDDFQYDFGTGGIHGSLHKQSVYADDEYEIWDWDVASYYPNLAITHEYAPYHLQARDGVSFGTIYKSLYERRKMHKKGTPENAMLKLALNVPYGQSNAPWSPFYDPQFTMSITINGQLLLCMLAEQLTHYMDGRGNLVSLSDVVQMVQINTDGLTIRVRKDYVSWMQDVCQMWQDNTGLVLESAEYSAMHIQNVNSYMAIKTDGSVKRIGAFRIETPMDNPNTHELQWHQDHSGLVITKAVDAYYRTGQDVADFIMNHREPFDFLLGVKVNRTSMRKPIYLLHGETEIQKTSRYYVSTTGAPLTKRMVKRNASDYSDTGIDVGWTVTITNDMDNFTWDNVNWLYYIEKAKELLV
jgi:hypothetical protein